MECMENAKPLYISYHISALFLTIISAGLSNWTQTTKQLTINLSFLKLILSLTFVFRNSLHIAINLFFHSSTLYLMFSLRITVQSRQERTQVIRKTTVKIQSSHLIYWSIKAKGCVSLWMMGQEKNLNQATSKWLLSS